MLERIEQIQGVGLLNQANGQRFKLHKATLIYGDNGRGKSTLASILRSLSEGDSSLVAERATLDSAAHPRAVLQFASGHKVTFQDGAWTEPRPEITVFDSDFIQKNVHSGGSVGSDQKKNLLEFALGENAVAARTDEETATQAFKEASDKLRLIKAQLTGFCEGTDFDVFEAMERMPDAEAQMARLEPRIRAAKSNAGIAAKPLPAPVVLPPFDVNAFFALLQKTVQDIEEDAEEIVRRHVTGLSSPAQAESWIHQGQNLDARGDCPFCGQSLDGLLLIRAYRTYFNQAYGELKKNVALLENGVRRRTDPSVIHDFANGIEQANERMTVWEDYISTAKASFDQAAAEGLLQQLQDHLLELAIAKQANPLRAVGSPEDQARAAALWRQLTGLMERSNEQVAASKASIENYKANLAADKAEDLQWQMKRLQLAQKRYSKEVGELFEQLKAARDAQTAADDQKQSARKRLNAAMTQTLSKFEQAINKLLEQFGASFRIQKLSANYIGGSPRGDYHLVIRGKPVKSDRGVVPFSTALSDGDQRTLAFAFFVAKTLEDPKLGEAIVVIDDPMCSLDRNRRRHTQAVLRQIYSRAGQLLVLAHDPLFLLELKTALERKEKPPGLTVLQLRRVENQYSDFAQMDLEEACESKYFKNHRILREYVEKGEGTPAHVGQGIRLLLEGYLLHRFPGRISPSSMLGEVIGVIKGADSNNPLSFAQDLVPELEALNEYATKFHHDDPGTVEVVEAYDLAIFAQRALDLVHGCPS